MLSMSCIRRQHSRATARVQGVGEGVLKIFELKRNVGLLTRVLAFARTSFWRFGPAGRRVLSFRAWPGAGSCVAHLERVMAEQASAPPQPSTPKQKAIPNSAGERSVGAGQSRDAAKGAAQDATASGPASTSSTASSSTNSSSGGGGGGGSSGNGSRAAQPLNLISPGPGSHTPNPLRTAIKAAQRSQEHLALLPQSAQSDLAPGRYLKVGSVVGTPHWWSIPVLQDVAPGADSYTRDAGECSFQVWLHSALFLFMGARVCDGNAWIL